MPLFSYRSLPKITSSVGLSQFTPTKMITLPLTLFPSSFPCFIPTQYLFSNTTVEFPASTTVFSIWHLIDLVNLSVSMTLYLFLFIPSYTFFFVWVKFSSVVTYFRKPSLTLMFAMCHWGLSQSPFVLNLHCISYNFPSVGRHQHQTRSAFRSGNGIYCCCSSSKQTTLITLTELFAHLQCRETCTFRVNLFHLQMVLMLTDFAKISRLTAGYPFTCIMLPRLIKF